MEKGSLHKHSSSSRKLGRQEGDGALGSLGLGAGKSKLKDKLSAIRQDRAERRESLQKQDAIHEVDSSEDETDDGSEDSQDGRRGGAFTPPPLLRPTTVRTGPGGTLPSLCLSPCTSHATFSHTGPSHSHAYATDPKPALSSDAKSTEEDVGQDGKVGGAAGASNPSQRPVPFATPTSAFISVGKDPFLRPTTPHSPTPPKATAEEDNTTVPRTTGPPSPPGGQGTSRSSCSSPGLSKEKKEADNRRLCAAGPASSSSCPRSTCSSLDPPSESRTDKTGSQISKSVLGPLRLSPAVDKNAPGQKPPTGAPDPPSQSPSAPLSPAATPSSDPRASAASEPKRKRSDAVTAVLAANAAAVSSQRDKAASKKT